MLTRTIKDTRSKSYPLDTKEEMRTQSNHAKSERLVSRKVRRLKAIDVDKDHQRHSIEILLAGFIGRDENIKYPRQRWTISSKCL